MLDERQGDTYRAGDPWAICDLCGFKRRFSDLRTEWTGAKVCYDKCFEPRHPQDFVRSRPERPPPKGLRPEGVDTVVGPLTTEINATAEAGATSITVLSSARFAADDRCGVMLDNNDVQQITILAVVDATTLSFSPGLQHRVTSGKTVVNYSAVSADNYG